MILFLEQGEGIGLEDYNSYAYFQWLLSTSVSNCNSLKRHGLPVGTYLYVCSDPCCALEPTNLHLVFLIALSLFQRSFGTSMYLPILVPFYVKQALFFSLSIDTHLFWVVLASSNSQAGNSI